MVRREEYEVEGRSAEPTAMSGDVAPVKLVFEAADGSERSFDLDMQARTVWLTQLEIAQLLGCGKSNVSRHISKIFRDKELVEESVVAYYSTAANDGKRYRIRRYSLPMLFSVSYKVDSVQAVRIRQKVTELVERKIIADVCGRAGLQESKLAVLTLKKGQRTDKNTRNEKGGKKRDGGTEAEKDELPQG